MLVLVFKGLQYNALTSSHFTIRHHPNHHATQSEVLVMLLNKTQINKPPCSSQIHICFGLEEKESWNDWFSDPDRSKLSACHYNLLLRHRASIT